MFNQEFIQQIKIQKTLVFIGFFGFITACAPTRFVKPLEHKQHAVTASFGGPVINVPGIATMPIPFTTIGYGYGLTPKTTVYGNFHTTSSVFGVVQFDFGTSHSIWKNEDNTKGVSIAPELNFMIDVFEKRASLYPQIDANYYMDYHNKEKDGKSKVNYLYFGLNNWFELRAEGANGTKVKQHIICSPQIGHTFDRGKWNYTLEAKILAPYVSNEKIVVDYKSILGNHGGLGLYFGVNYKL